MIYVWRPHHNIFRSRAVHLLSISCGHATQPSRPQAGSSRIGATTAAITSWPPHAYAAASRPVRVVGHPAAPVRRERRPWCRRAGRRRDRQPAGQRLRRHRSRPPQRAQQPGGRAADRERRRLILVHVAGPRAPTAASTSATPRQTPSRSTRTPSPAPTRSLRWASLRARTARPPSSRAAATARRSPPILAGRAGSTASPTAARMPTTTARWATRSSPTRPLTRRSACSSSWAGRRCCRRRFSSRHPTARRTTDCPFRSPRSLRARRRPRTCSATSSTRPSRTLCPAPAPR